MHRQAIWVWCLTFLLLPGCEAQLHISVSTPKSVLVVKHQGYTMLSRGKTVAKVTVIPAEQPTSFSIMLDPDNGSSYVTETVHDCVNNISTLVKLSIYDSVYKLIEASTEPVVLSPEPDSLGEAEHELSCLKQPKDTSDV